MIVQQPDEGLPHGAGGTQNTNPIVVSVHDGLKKDPNR
jgi:hypothetical protein